MSTYYVDFNQLCQKVEYCGATREKQCHIYKTWWGWVTKGVLHIVSYSGAADKKIWHFKKSKNKNRKVGFSNTTGSVWCWTIKSGMEEKNPYKKVIGCFHSNAKVTFGGNLKKKYYIPSHSDVEKFFGAEVVQQDKGSLLKGKNFYYISQSRIHITGKPDIERFQEDFCKIFKISDKYFEILKKKYFFGMDPLSERELREAKKEHDSRFKR